MPLYEYQCEKCGEVFEVIQKFADDPLTAHEACGGAVHRLLSAPALQFKGSGWYITDYAKSSKPSSSSSEKSEKSAKKSESPAKTESSEKKPSAPSSGSESHA